ncbi:hypothetical protein Ancab_009865 [Ancistrocladus abbreviatus]
MYFTSNTMKGSKDSSSDYTDTALRLGSVTVISTNLYGSGGNKRKWCVIGGSYSSENDTETSLVLGFGCSGSSPARKKADSGMACTSVTSGREIESSSQMNLSIDLNLHQGNHVGACKEAICSSLSLGARAKKRPDVDLELSLSAAAAESDVTGITLASSPVQNSMEVPAVSVVQLIDEGSTSSKWKQRPFLPPQHAFHCTNTSIVLDGNSNNANPVSVTPALKSTAVARPNGLVCAAMYHPNQQRKTSVKTCQVPGCEKGARGASGRCIAHGGGRRCQRAGCQKGAEGKTAFCKAHGGGRRCEHLGCTKSAEGRTNFCIAHGGGRRCSYSEGCTRAARGKSGLCIRHGGGKRCKMENCTKSAEGLSGLCIAHGGGRRCQYPGCTKGAQGSTKFCKAHGGGKRCTYLGCTKGAEGSTPFCKAHGGGKRCSFQGHVCAKSVHGGTLFCVAHGGGKRCAVPECTKSARGRTSYCVCHGGGRRCKYEGCGKSAQGSTDFCKAHGGGKRCLWGQTGSGYGDSSVPCAKFARGKIGLCAAHNSQVLDHCVHGDVTVGLMLREAKSKSPEKVKEIAAGVIPLNTMKNASGEGSSTCWNSFSFTGFGRLPLSVQVLPSDKLLANQCTNLLPTQGFLPEGRVHGGGLMAMLQGHPGFRPTGAA